MVGYRLQLPGAVPATSAQWMGDDERTGTSVCVSLADLVGYLWTRSAMTDGRVIIRCEGELAPEDDVDASAAGAPVLLLVERHEVDDSPEAARALRILRALDVAGIAPMYSPDAPASLAEAERVAARLIRDAAMDAAQGRWDLVFLRRLNRARRILTARA